MIHIRSKGGTNIFEIFWKGSKEFQIRTEFEDNDEEEIARKFKLIKPSRGWDTPTNQIMMRM